jgi:hypothetical protein
VGLERCPLSLVSTIEELLARKSSGFGLEILKYEFSSSIDSLCGLVIRVPGYRSKGSGSIPGHYKENKNSGSATGSTQLREDN